MENTCITSVEIGELCRAKSILENIMPSSKKEIVEIYEKISSYIDKNCKHVLIRDSIDISLDTSKTIVYCEICLQTFEP
jgi:RNase P subunit RPR2